MRFATMSLLTAALFGVGLLFVGPLPVVAQPPAEAECTAKCGCISGEGCGCQSTGGNGSTCDASGDGCFVHRCDAHTSSASAFLAPDGSVLFHGATQADEDGMIETFQSGLWEILPSGISVAKNCSGVIVDRFVTRGRAAALRAESLVLSTQSTHRNSQ